MKKYIRLFAIPALAWVFGIGLTLLPGGCDSADTSPKATGIDTDMTDRTESHSTDTAKKQEIAGTLTPEPTASPVPEPTATSVPMPTKSTVPVNTNTSTVTYLVNRDYPLPEDFVPEGLTTPDVLFPFSDTTIDKAKMTPEAGEALALLFDAAYEEAGLTLYGVSAYRSYARQYTIYATNLAVYGIPHTNRYSAAPGRSEHQTGLSIDISCASEGFALEDTFADTPEGIWVAENAHRFGFIMRYPKDKEDITGYNYEPWHIRYVGTELADSLHTTGLTLEEYYGVSSSLSAEYLDTTPFIDTTAESYLAIYRQYH